MPRLIRRVVDGLPEAEAALVEAGIDVIGDLAVVKFPEISQSAKESLAARIMEEMGGVKGVFEQEGGIEGEYRLRKLRPLAGEDRTLTVHRENGCTFRVDISKVFYSPRLSTERLRVATRVHDGEKILNMFAGVGPFSITIAKKRDANVTSCEVNRSAYDLHIENNGLNKVSERISMINADAASLPYTVNEKFDRILMPHPSHADKYLETASSLLKDEGEIQYYRHVTGHNLEEAQANLTAEVKKLLPRIARLRVRKVREVGPRWLEMAADIVVGS